MSEEEFENKLNIIERNLWNYAKIHGMAAAVAKAREILKEIEGIPDDDDLENGEIPEPPSPFNSPIYFPTQKELSKFSPLSLVYHPESFAEHDELNPYYSFHAE